jgi:hypothetical protein
VDYNLNVGSNCGFRADSATYNLVFRYDLHSALKTKKYTSSFNGTPNSYTAQSSTDFCFRFCCGKDTFISYTRRIDSSYQYSLEFDINKRKITPLLGMELNSVDGTAAYPKPRYFMDSVYNILPGSFDTVIWSSEFQHMSWSQAKIEFPPPSNLLSVQTFSSSSSLSLSFFPNPSSKELNSSYSLPGNSNARIILYDLQGRVIRETANYSEVGEHQMKWDVSQLASGSYILGLITDKERKAEIVSIVH